MKRVAAFGDVHGCLTELKELYSRLCWESLDEIRHSGDLVDRGPDSGGVVAFCREHGIKGIQGNHDGVIVSWLDRNTVPKNPDKAHTYRQLTDERDRNYLRSLPILHVDDEIQTVFVHGGLYPGLPFHKQSLNVTRLQMFHPKFPGQTRWFNKTRDGVSEAELYQQGWRRWYEHHDHAYNVVYGHTVWKYAPRVHRNAQFGKTIGVDTGCNWSGQLTAVIMPDLRFVSTPLTRDFTYPDPNSWDDA